MEIRAMSEQEDLSGGEKPLGFTSDAVVESVRAWRDPWLFSILAWSAVVVGVACFTCFSTEDSPVPFVGTGICGLIAFIAGIMTTVMGLRIQGTFQILGGLVLMALPLLLILAAAGGLATMAGQG